MEAIPLSFMFSLVFVGTLFTSKQSSAFFTNDFVTYNNSGQLPEITEEYQKYCPENDLCTAPSVTNGYGCCQYCSCGIDCYESGTCCPDVLQYFSGKLNQTCIRPQYFNYGVTNVSLTVSMYMVHRCPAGYTDKKIKKQCENIPEVANTFNDFQYFIPYSKVNSSLAYRNRYCGICNGESNTTLIRWHIRLLCSTRHEIQVDSFGELLSNLHRDKKCNFVFNVPSWEYFPKICFWGKVTKCNQTGTMTQYNTSLINYCESFTSLYRQIYRNIYCFLCNSEDDPSLCDIDFDSGEFDTIAFSAIMDFDVISREPPKQNLITNGNSCASHQQYDNYKEVCRNITCVTGAIFLDGKCKSQYENEAQRSYDVYLLVQPNDNQKVCLAINDSFDTQLVSGIHSLLDSDSFVINEACSVMTLFKAGSHQCFENKTSLSYLLVHMEIYIGLLHPVDLYLEEFFSLNNKQINIDNANFSVQIDSRNFGDIEYGSLTRHYMDPEDHEELSLIRASVSETNFDCNGKVRHMRVTKMAYCPRVLMDENEYTTKVSNDTVCFSDIDLCLDDGSYKKMENGYEICSDVYFDKTYNMTQNSIPSDCSMKISVALDTLNVVSIIFTSFSMFSLFFTILTYSLFNVLRSIPGVNNMILSINMLIAQGLYLFGTAQSYLGVGCTIIGILIHYFWLSTILWMNVCSFHMHRVFSTLKVKSINSRQDDVNLIVKYCIYSFTVPLFPILINAVISLTWSEWTDIGYGGCVCYISSTLLILYTFALPIGILLISNIIFFIIVIVSIRRSHNSKLSSNREQISISVYVKLSCLTGTSWIFGFMQNWIDHDIIRILFIIFSAGQGLFIFISFICSKRVLNLYLELLKCNKSKTKQRPPLSGTTSNTSKTTTENI